jgi:lysophospholipase L1-like esterase
MTRSILAALLAATTLWTPRASGQESRFEQWEPEIRAFEQSDRESAPAPGAILFVGSSSIRMWSDLASDFPSAKVINRGFGGSTIADSTHFADRIVVPYHPRKIFLYAGDNDLANGLAPSQVLADFEAFVSRVRRELPKTEIFFIAIKPSLAREKLLPQMREANALVRDYAARHEGVTYVDVFTTMLTKDGKPRPELFGEDGLHMNRKGYDVWRDTLAPHVR